VKVTALGPHGVVARYRRARPMASRPGVSRKDIPPGLALVEVFTPFLQHSLEQGYARKTLRMLGGHLIEVRHEDPDSAAMDAHTLVLNQVHEYGAR
jgi:hypothetical protein